jgi:hypothetical protein
MITKNSFSTLMFSLHSIILSFVLFQGPKIFRSTAWCVDSCLPGPVYRCNRILQRRHEGNLHEASVYVQLMPSPATSCRRHEGTARQPVRRTRHHPVRAPPTKDGHIHIHVQVHPKQYA